MSAGRFTMSKALADVLAMRTHQVAKGYTAAHDDEHTDGELADAAACRALMGAGWRYGEVSFFWPFDALPNVNTPARDNLVAAAAMLLAEIERRDRLPHTGA